MTGFIMNTVAAVVFGLASGNAAVAVAFLGLGMVCLLGRDTEEAE